MTNRRSSRCFIAAWLAICVMILLVQKCAAQTLTPPEAQATAEMARQQATTVSRLATANAPTRTPVPTSTPLPTMTATSEPSPTATMTVQATETKEATMTAQPTTKMPTVQPDTDGATLRGLMLGGVVVLIALAWLGMRWLSK